MRFARLFVGIAVVVFPALAYAAAPSNFKALATSVAQILNYGAGTLLTAAIVVYFFSIATNLYRINQGEASGDDLRKTILWGIAILFFMVSIWGIIQYLQYSLFNNTGPSASNGIINYQSP